MNKPTKRSEEIINTITGELIAETNKEIADILKEVKELNTSKE